MLFNASSEESQMNAITVKISKFRHLPFPPSVWEAHIMLIPTNSILQDIILIVGALRYTLSPKAPFHINAYVPK